MNYCGNCKHFRVNPTTAILVVDGTCTLPIPGSVINHEKYTVAQNSMILCSCYNRKKALPYGFKESEGEVIENQGEQAILSLVKEYSDKGLSLRQVSNVLAQQGVKSRDSKPFTL